MVGVILGVHRNHRPRQKIDDVAQLVFTFTDIAFLIVDEAGDDRFLFVEKGKDALGLFLLKEALSEIIHAAIKTIGFDFGDVQRKVFQQHQ